MTESTSITDFSQYYMPGMVEKKSLYYVSFSRRAGEWRQFNLNSSIQSVLPKAMIMQRIKY